MGCLCGHFDRGCDSCRPKEWPPGAGPQNAADWQREVTLSAFTPENDADVERVLARFRATLTLAARLSLAEELTREGASDEQVREFIETGLFTAELIASKVVCFQITGIAPEDEEGAC